MLQLYDLNKVKISNLTLYKDLKIQSVLNTGDKTLSFLYPSRSSDEIKEEGYIRTKTHEFVIKEISTNGDWKSIQAVLNVEDLEGKTWEHFDTSNQTITDCLTLALAGTGWIIGYCNETKKRTISKTNCSTWDIIQAIKKTYFVEMEFDTLNKRINIAKKLGNDKGVYFIDSLNLKDLDVKSNSYDFCTRLIAIGENDLKVTVENYQYSSKKKTIIWKAEKYTDENSLREDAIAKLEELSKPYKSYGADIVDLASINDKYSILSYGLGDIITLISKEEGIKEKQRIVKMVEYPDEPDKNTCEIANTVLTFEDIQKEYEDTSKTVNNITSSNGTISEGAIKGTVEKITIDKADIKSLNAVEIRVGTLEATSATITDLKAANANIAKLKADKADIGELNAGVGRIEILESSVGDIKTLVNGNLTSSNIHSLILTSDKVTVDNGFIKNAMIDRLDVSKINAGDISTNKFRIKSDNGGIEIVGATQQFKDKNNRVRIQMGQDTKGDFNFILRGEDGTTTLMDHTGIKENAIADDLIKGNMISENAIGGKQIDYNSFTEEFNKDTNTNTLKSSKVLLDKTNQTLNVAFDRLDTKVDSAPPKVTTEESITKLDGAIDGMLKLNSIKGRTLQNLVYDYSKCALNTEFITSNTIAVLGALTEKTVTIINYADKMIHFQTSKMDDSFNRSVDIPAKSHQVITLSSSEKFRTILALYRLGWEKTNESLEEFKKSFILLEGNYTNKPVPDYFEGIKSVGETGENLEVVSCGKNLFDTSKITLIEGFTISDNVITLNAVKNEMASIITINNLKRGITYTLSANIIGDGYLGGKIINAETGFSWVNSTNKVVRLSLKPDTTSITLLLKNLTGRGIITFSEIQLEEGITPTPYEPYQEHRQLIALTEPLRGLPNGVKDTINKDVVTRNIGKVVLNGSENWALILNNTNGVSSFMLPIVNVKYKDIICDKFRNGNQQSTTAIEESITISSGENSIVVFISSSKLSSQTAIGFKAWLQANPTTVYYEIATPVETSIKVEQYMKQYKDGYFLTDGSLINPEVEFDYSTSLASASSMMKEVTESNSTYLNVQQGKIDSLITNTTIVKDGKTIQLKDSYNSTVATVDSINSTIGKHTSTIDALTGKVTGVDTKVNTVQRDLDGVKTTVSNTTTTANSALSKATEAKQTADGFSQRVGNIETNYATTTSMNSAITQSATGIKSEVSKTYLNKNEAATTYATNASMELTDSQLRLDFSSSGGYNCYLRKCYTARLTGTATIYHDSMEGFDERCKGTRVVAPGIFESRFQKVIPKNGTYSISFYAKANNGNYPTVQFELCDKFVGTAWINNKWKLFKFENVVVDNWSDIYSFMDIRVSAGNSWDFAMSHICINEGPIALPWSPNPTEIYSGSTQIDANGVTIYNGAITIMDKWNNKVLTADDYGDLSLIGNITTYSGDRKKKQLDILKSSISFYDWETQEYSPYVGRIYTAKQIVNGNYISTPSITIENSDKSFIAVKSLKGYLMHFDDYNKSTYSGNIPIWFYKNAIMGIGASMYFNMPGNKGRIFGGSTDTLIVEVPVAKKDNGFIVQSNSGTPLINTRAGYDYINYLRDTYIEGKFAVLGSKNSIQKTKNYGERLINAYETAEYFFGDLGSGKILNGECLISIDEILLECINTSHQYHVFTQVYNGDISKIERFKDYFVVHGEEGTEFSWELKAKRVGYENNRLETPNDFDNRETYENMFNRHFEEFEAEKTTERQSVEGDMYTNDTLAGDMLMNELDFKLDEFLFNKEEI